MKIPFFIFLSVTLVAGLFCGFVKDPADEIITLKGNGDQRFPIKLDGLIFRQYKRTDWIAAYTRGKRDAIGLVADERSLEKVYKYMDNPDYNLEKVAFCIVSPLLASALYIWRRRQSRRLRNEATDNLL